MKKSRRVKTEKMNIGKTNQIISKPIIIFFITLSIFVLLGMIAILMWKTLGEVEPTQSDITQNENEEKTSKQQEENDFDSLWESIPEPQQEPETVDTNQKYAKELADEEYRKENHILAWECANKESVSISFVGDILLDDEYAILANLLRRGITIENGISEPMLTQMRDADILVVNNEFPYTNRGTPIEGKTYTFRADPSMVSYLQDMGADVAVLANNHILDFGETGLIDTLETLSNAGIPHIGAGSNIKEASAPLYFITNDIKIALIAATQIERLDNPDTKGATETSAGTFRCWNPELLYETIATAKQNSDFVIVYVHWGTENEAEPDWAQTEQSAGMADAGADLIIGDHPHCLQGITFCNKTPVIYSLGNFWFNSKTLDTGMMRAVIGKDGLQSLQFVPAIQQDCRTDLAYGEEKSRILNYMQSLSGDVVIDSEGYIALH